MKNVFFTVTNDLTYDQRMHRICTSLSAAGFRVTLVGRKQKHSPSLTEKTFIQKRIPCLFRKGALFYAEYNTRLFFYLLFKKMDGICAIDLDTILPCLLVSKLKRIPRIYDAHEFFTELKEVRSRPLVQKVWLAVERFSVPKFDLGYTVGEGIAHEFKKRYRRNYSVIRNVPVTRVLDTVLSEKKFLLYQGAVNEGRGFEYLIPAMKQIEFPLVVCGDGNFMRRLKELVRINGVEDKVELMGMLHPEELFLLAQKAGIGLGLAEKEGLNQYLALPNKFFDYLHACLPQIAMDFPEYRAINNQFGIAVLIPELSVDVIVATINRLMTDEIKLEEMKKKCLTARAYLCWEKEEQKLIQFYKNAFSIE